MSTTPFADLNLSEADKKDLSKFIEVEQSKNQLQTTVHTFTDQCWDRCVKKIGNRLDSSEETCLENCVERFVDTSLHILQKFQGGQH